MILLNFEFIVERFAENDTYNRFGRLQVDRFQN